MEENGKTSICNGKRKTIITEQFFRVNRCEKKFEVRSRNKQLK